MNIQDFFMQTQRIYGVGPMRIEYAIDAQDRLEYIGFAPKGTATTDNVWFITKYTYQSVDSPVAASEKTGPFPCIWNNRTSLSYT